MHRRRPLVLLLALALSGAVGCGSSSSEQKPELPRSFFGVAPQDFPSAPEFARMASGNVGSYHLFISWATVERDEGFYDWSDYDRVLGELATHGIEPIPYVFGTPRHLADNPRVPPTDSPEALAAWREFLTAAAERYGPGGELWERFAVTDPGIEPQPLEVWEIWNEVNSPTFWDPEPSPSAYAELLEASSDALRSVDPAAQLMTAGMFATPLAEGSISSFEFLETLFEEEGVTELIDLVGIHPYGPAIDDVSLQISETRDVMKESGKGDTGIWVSEIGWGSDGRLDNQLAKTPAEQARLLRQTYKLLISKREQWRIQGALWYTWRDPARQTAACSWCPSAGLFDRDLDPKPAWFEFTKLSGGEA